MTAPKKTLDDTLSLLYGHSDLPLPGSGFHWDDTIAEPCTPILDDPLQAVHHSLRHPLGIPNRLRDDIQNSRARDVAIIVNDITRPTPYRHMLPPLLEEIRAAGLPDSAVRFVVATGVHRGNTFAEIQEMFGRDTAARYTFLNHDCDRESDLVYLGTLRHGSELWVNRAVTDADYVIATGVIAPHYFAGFSGGRKAVLPGVSGRATITTNHSHLTDKDAAVGNLNGNPVHQEMMDAARKVGVNFILNVVPDSTGKNIVGVVAGDLEKAWLAGVESCARTCFAPLASEYDVVIASAGGFPKDINLYQAQKAVENAARAVRPGGTIVLAAECPEGLGDSIFEQWMFSASGPADVMARFQREFVVGGHKAYVLARVLAEKDVIIVSTMPTELVRRVFMIPAANLGEAARLVSQKHGDNYRALIMPHAGLVAPNIQPVSESSILASREVGAAKEAKDAKEA